jgi:PRTRC genetic system protein C
MQVEQMEREFTYNGVGLPDPGFELSVDQVRDIYSAVYPEFATAAAEDVRDPVHRDLQLADSSVCCGLARVQDQCNAFKHSFETGNLLV